MSMSCSIFRLTEQETNTLLAFPDAVNDLVGNTPPPLKTNFWSMIFGTRDKQTPLLPQRLSPVSSSNTFELNQAWHILHYLLSGVDAEGEWPKAFIMSGGQEVGPDLGYGPARLMNTSLSKDIADFLGTQSKKMLDAAYDVTAIQAAKIYWQPSSDPAERELQIEELWSLVTGLKSFLEESVLRQGAALVHIF